MLRKSADRLATGGAVLATVALLTYGSFLAARQRAVQKWPTTAATVVHFDRGTDPRWEGNWYANPKVAFEYQVAGRRFLGSRLNPSPFNYQDENRLSAETDHLRPGRPVLCSFNPEDPADAYLLNLGVTDAPRVLIGCGGVCAALLLTRAWMRMRSRRDGRSAGNSKGSEDVKRGGRETGRT